jgi:TonB-dependent Receptor Plug Domain
MRLLRIFLPIFSIALMVQLFAPIGACMSAAIAASDPFRTIEICHEAPRIASDAGQQDDQAGMASTAAPASSAALPAQMLRLTRRRSTRLLFFIGKPPALSGSTRWRAFRGLAPIPIRGRARHRRFPDRTELKPVWLVRAVVLIFAAHSRGRQEFGMYCKSIFWGASSIAIGIATLASPDVVLAQTATQTLPSVVIEAPKQAANRAAKRQCQRNAAMKRVAPNRGTPPPAEQPAPAASASIDGGGVNASYGTPPVVARYQLPQESYSITAKQIDETINLKDPEDAVKYMPSLFVRKRNNGDNQAVLATRNWGLNSSARTLIYYDDLLISALIGNNNSGASPHWNLVSPEAIKRIDFLDGPFAAAYPGNSIGGVLLITSKMPDKPFVVAKETVSVMPWNQYGTKDTYVTSQTSAAAGNRNGALSCLVTANYLDSYQQPLTYTTNGSIPARTTGTFPALNKQGVVADVVGTGALAHSQQTSGNVRLVYDVTPIVQGTYSLGVWNNV